jgi:hypothetical protein
MANSNPYTYVLVRRDIPLADQIVQACHASLEAGFSFERPAVTSSLVLLGVDNEASLKEWAAKLEYNGIRCEVFHEPDDSMGFTALASQPLVGAQREIFSTLKLWSQP